MKNDVDDKQSYFSWLKKLFSQWLGDKKADFRHQELLQLAFKSSKIGIWSWEISNDSILWDDQTHYIFGIKPDSIQSPKNFNDFLDFLHPDDRTSTKNHLQKIIAKKEAFELFFRVIYPDKSVHFIGTSGKVYLNANQTLSIAGICYDRTTQQLEEEAIKGAKEQAEESLRLQGDFMAKISHDLRAPLNAIIGFAQLMYDSKVGPVSLNHKEYLNDILTSAHQLLSLIDAILDLSKVEAGKMEFHSELCDLIQIVQDTRGVFHTLINNKNIQFDTIIDPIFQQVILDPIRFKQILYNFVSNALKCTPDGGKVTVRISLQKENLLHLEIEDNGIGIRQEDLKNLFVEFKQFNREIAKKYPSSGLGLALTKHIVEAQGGSVGVSSTFGKGSVFFANLPVEFSLNKEQHT